MSVFDTITSSEALAKLWVLCDKPERIRAFDIIDNHYGLSDEEFWSSFWGMWTSHESIYLDHAVIHDMIARHDASKSTASLDEDEIKTLQGLPDRVEIYRGCRNKNAKGWSWSLDYNQAVFFAERSAGVGLPLVLHGTVSKANILAYLNGRSEQEIVVDPKNVLVGTREKLARLDSRRDSHNRVFQMIHAGARDSSFGNRDRAMMIVAQSIATNKDTDAIKEYVSKDIDIARALGSTQADFFQAVLDIIDEWEAGGDEIHNMVAAFGQTHLAIS